MRLEHLPVDAPLSGYERQAEELLAAHRASVTEAAFAVGFADVAAFTRAFRRWNGVPPGEWSRRR